VFFEKGKRPVIAQASEYVYAVDLAELQARRCMAVQVSGHTIALYYHDGDVYAVDNRCPHMGFPLDRGSVHGGILTCHWHHARFDLASGGAFDLWADDVRTYPVQIRDNAVWIDVATPADLIAHQRERLQVGLERDLSLVIGKSVLTLLEGDRSPVEPFRAGLEFGVRYRAMGWGQGLTMLGCFMNMLPVLYPEDRSRALYHGLSAVARDSAGSAPRFPVRPLPGSGADLPTLKRWFRQFIEVRDAEGAERCIISAVRSGANAPQMADMLFSAVTDHRYIQVGHPADFTNKAFEALDIAGWELAEPVLTSLADGYAGATRMEESNAWRHPIDLVALLEATFERLPAALADGEQRRTGGAGAWNRQPELVETLLADQPTDSAEAMLAALREGCTPERLAAAVAYAAALRIARFHTSNEFGDWDTALHTFTFANAIHQGLRRAPSAELLRGVFDAAMSIYLDRFLNLPAARLPEPNGAAVDPGNLLDELIALLDRQQQVNPAARQVAQYLYAGGDPAPLLARIGRLLLREDRDFHTIQTVEAAMRQHAQTADPTAASHFLIAAIRYLAAHSPTVRAQGQTYQIAVRLHQGDRIFEEA
jgi:nitrite reductase/ring-hydroxylating ferredoxin subunit